MHILGYHTGRPPGPRWPTADEVQFTHDAARGKRFRYRKGVIRFRNDDEADARMCRLVADARAEAAGRRRGRLPGAWIWRAVRRLWLTWR